MTGVSGSGKSSLAFDTIYAEGQRRYVESLSAYARQFLERMEKPDVDSIEGICPAIAIRQKNSIRNPRSTVGTTTEIHDYLRLLYARVGRTFCRNCGREVIRETAEVVARRLGAPAGGHAAADRLRHAGRRVRRHDPRSRSGRGRRRGRGEEAGEEAAPPQPALPGPGRIPSPRRSRRCAGRASAACWSTASGVARGRRCRRRFEDRATLQVIVDRHQGRRRPARRGSPTRSRPRTSKAAAPRSRSSCRRCRADRRAPVQRAVRVPAVRHPVRGAAAAAVLVQQPVRRLPGLPRLRQHHRARHGPRRAGPVEVDPAERDRAVEQAALPRPARRAEAGGARARRPPGRAVVAADRRGKAVRHRG